MLASSFWEALHTSSKQTDAINTNRTHTTLGDVFPDRRVRSRQRRLQVVLITAIPEPEAEAYDS